MARKFYRTEEGISDSYLEGVLKHSGSISEFIYVFTQLVKNSEGDGRRVMCDVDEALSRLLGELGSSVAVDQMMNGAAGEPQKYIDSINLLYWMNHKPNFEDKADIEKAILQIAESLADPNFFIAEISGILSALVELKSVCHRRSEGSTID
jgi:hypothetical protein